MHVNPAIQSHPLPKQTAAKIDEVARQLEGQFAQLLIKSMRDASFGDALFPGENKLFHEMRDAQLAKALTQGNGLGIAQLVAKQLQGQSAAPVPVVNHVTKTVSAATRKVAERFSSHTPEQFVATIWQHAKRAARELGVDARALVAQAALETGWGQRSINHADGRSSHNLFGIKASGWNGERVNAHTHEYRGGICNNESAEFRSYASPADSFADYVRLLKTNPRYRKALQAGSSAREFARTLQQAGYATDPHYAEKISAIAGGATLKRALAAVEAQHTAARGITPNN